MQGVRVILATIDLGSNSFHLLVVESLGGKVVREVARHKEKVQLRAGLQKDGTLDEAAQNRALKCFARFSTILKAQKPDKVKVVGTYTLRSALNLDNFLIKAHKTLGYPIEIISGEEEARLIYVGVSSEFQSEQQCLVVDIGGGSTEFVIGNQSEIIKAKSLNMGCVSFQQQYFEDGLLSTDNFDRAVLGAKENLNEIAQVYKTTGWSVCVGSSGTIQAISSVLNVELDDTEITLHHLNSLREKLKTLIKVDAIHLPGLRQDRENILPGGLSILIAIFETLEIKKMSMSRAAIREGVMFELLVP